jgi:aminobutyraldehyde dehydrogenase
LRSETGRVRLDRQREDGDVGSRAGCVWVNQHFTLVNEMPHGGRQMSGDGKDVSVYGLEDYTVVRHVMVNFG